MSEERWCKKLSGEEIKKLEKNRLEDHRSISAGLFHEFSEGRFSAFREFVIKHQDELVACFRGNGHECIIIYYNNHRVWKLDKLPNGNCRVTISFDHARYYNEKGDWKSLMQNYFADFNERELKITKKNEVGIGYLTCEDVQSEDTKFTAEFVSNSYRILKPIITSFFSLEDKYKEDQFRNSKGIPQTQNRKSPYIEKRWQQKLFQYFKNTDTGLFAYDLEFSQPFPNDPIRKKMKEIVNEPDMLAIRFVNKIPKALVLIEVKSTARACNSTDSGIKKHLPGMKRYSECDRFMLARKEDAGRILKQYYESGLYQAELEGIKYLLTDNENDGINWPANTLEVERMLILTDNVLPENEKNSYQDIDAIQCFEKSEEYKKIAADNACEVYRISGHYFDREIEYIKIDLAKTGQPYYISGCESCPWEI